MGQRVLAIDAHVERLAHEVLETVDGVDGPTLRVDIDGVDGHIEVLAVRLDAVLVVGVRREVDGVARVGEVAAVVDRTDGHVQQTWARNNSSYLISRVVM